MKKFIIVVLLITMITAGIFSQNAVIRELSGDVELKHAGSSNFVTAKAGDSVAPNTIVSTGFRSTAVVVIGSSVLTIRPLTRLTLAEIQTVENNENVNVNLQAGRVRVDVKPPSGTRANMSVQSPSATASVRGTSFEMDVDKMNVLEGKVLFSGKAGAGVIVTGGSESISSKDGTPVDPAAITASSLVPSAPVGTLAPEMTSQPSIAEGDGETGFTVGLDYSGN